MLKRLLSIFLLSSLFTGAAYGVEDIYVTDTLKTLPGDMELRSLYLQALCFKKKGRADSAMILLNKYVERDTTNGAVYMDIANMYISAGNYRESLVNMQKAAQLEPNNYWILRSEALLLIQNGKTDEGLTVYENLIKTHPDKVEDIASLATLYTRVGRKREALAMWNRYEQQVGLTEQVSMSKFDLLYQLGEKKRAEAVVDSLVATDPTTPSYYIAKANAYAYRNDYKKAEKVLLPLRKKFPDSKSIIEQELSLVYLESGQSKKAVACIKNMLGAADVTFEVKRSVLISAVSDSALSPYFGNSDFESLVKQYPKNDQAYLIYSDFLLANKDKRGVDYVRKATEVNPKNELAWIALLTYYENAGEDKLYRETLDKAYAENPESGQLQFYMGTASMAAGNREKALSYWKKSARSLSKEKSQNMRTSVVYSVIGNMCIEDKDTIGAFVAFDSALVYNSNNIEVLNNYAYFLSEAGKDLERAERMSGKTIAVAPKNVTFLDTYAWIFYKMGKFSTARLYMEQAIMLGGDKEPDLLDHYGDILYESGEKEGAWENWKKALNLSSKPSETLKRKAETGKLTE
ncbi:MAG: tetratricopeptide repeat protein [Paludibacteraceae bacterium]|nr:tetratricopeptide repeat protein [Paludibacteraceae bacterium]MBR6104490.1 tetratricopeptide repeat protein [Paludibacteraceae bacterium]